MFTSVKTHKGNVATSLISQEEADKKALAMDAANCVNCYNCNNCDYCYNCNSCHNCNNCDYCYNCNSCYNCNNCNYCDNCNYSKGILIWAGKPAYNLLAINGLYWPVTISTEQIQIGCQLHTIDAWSQFSDREILAMDGPRALQFWRTYKTIILSLAKAKKESPND